MAATAVSDRVSEYQDQRAWTSRPGDMTSAAVGSTAGADTIARVIADKAGAAKASNQQAQASEPGLGVSVKGGGRK